MAPGVSTARPFARGRHAARLADVPNPRSEWEPLEWQDVAGAHFLLSQAKNLLALVGAGALLISALKAAKLR
jgi:hypothetical protein